MEIQCRASIVQNYLILLTCLKNNNLNKTIHIKQFLIEQY